MEDAARALNSLDFRSVLFVEEVAAHDVVMDRIYNLPANVINGMDGTDHYNTSHGVLYDHLRSLK